MPEPDTKSSRKILKESRHEFLEENDCQEVATRLFPQDCCGKALQDFDAQTHDAWLMQCPKGLDPGEVLNQKRIKMPGRRYVGDLQVRATNYTQPLSEAIGYVNAKGKYALRTLPLTGYVVVSKRLNQQQPPQGEGELSHPKPTPPPQYKLPVRHPFFGRDFKKRIEVPKHIAKALDKADEQSVETTARLRRTANYYKIRGVLLATTQTLEEKEHDVRQSVLTGVTPKFMKDTTHPVYVDLTEEPEEEVPKKRSKKRKVNGEVNETIKEEAAEQETATPRKRKKLKTPQ